MDCVNCGEPVAEPVWATYADEAFKDKQKYPFPLHDECFNRDKVVTISEWVPDPDAEAPESAQVLAFRDVTRYTMVEAP